MLNRYTLKNMRLSYRLALLGGVFCLLIIGIFFFSESHSRTLTFSDIETFANNPVRIPPMTYRDAIYAAFSLPEVRDRITKEHEHLTQYARSLELFQRITWQASATSSRLEEISETYWLVTFRCISFRPSFICNITFTESSIIQGVADIKCAYEAK